MKRPIFTKGNQGFGSRIFLTESEWSTFCKNKPVRYCFKEKPGFCEVCGEAATKDRPLENAHKIPFTYGVVQLGLTPDYVNRHCNFVAAHRGKCNAKAEITLNEIFKQLKKDGVIDIPDHLPESLHTEWRNQ